MHGDSQSTETPAREWCPFTGRPPCLKRGDLDCLAGCEFGMAGPCERERKRDWEDYGE